MTTIYPFQALYTKGGLSTNPANAPTLTVVDSDNNIVVNAASATQVANQPGLYVHEYTGADNLRLFGVFHTDDATMDVQDLPSYTPDVLTNMALLLTGAWIRTAIGLSSPNLESLLKGVIPTQAASSQATLVLYMDSDNSVTVTGLMDMTGYTEIWFTAKDNLYLDDQDALVQIHLSDPPDYLLDGLLVLEGDAPDPGVTYDLTDAALDVLSSTSLRIRLTSLAASLLKRVHSRSAWWGIKAKIGGLNVVIAEGGYFEVRPITTKTI